jgi:hypothetical protein
MAGEVVGTAFVRIKALTSGLAKDIESQVKKGMEGANLDKIGSDAGDEIGENLGEKTVDSAKKTIRKRSKGIFQDVADQAKRTSAEIRESFEAGTLDFSYFDNQSPLDKFLTNLKIKLNSADTSLRNFFIRTSEGFRSMANIDNESGFGGALDRLGQRLKSFGDGGFEEALSKIPLKITAVGAAIVGALPFIQDIGAAVLAYATGLVAQIGFLATALGGLGVAAGAAIGSAATVLLPLTLAFKSETEALVTFRDSLAAAGEEFLRIGTATQATLLPALDEALFIIQDLVEPLSEFGLFVGRAVGEFALLAANTLTGTEAMGRFQEILQSALRILDMLLPTVLNVGNILSGIWVAALPAAEQFVGTISDLTARLSETITEGLRTGTLAETFSKWYDRAELLGGAIANVAGALFDILSIGADSSDNLFVRFDEWAERYRAFTESESGQNRIALIFDNALAVMREINGVAAELFDGIFGRLGEVGGVDSLVGALQRVQEVLPGLQEGFQDTLDSIREVVVFILENLRGKVGQAIEELADPLGRLAFQILDLLKAMEESGAFEIFLDLLRIMTDTLSTLLAIPGFGTFIGYMIAFGGATRVARLALGPFIGVFGSFVTQIAQLIAVGKGKALTDTATGLSRLVAGFRNTAVVSTGAQAVQSAAGIVTNSAGGIATAVGSGGAALGGLALPLGLAAGALAIGGIAFFNHQQKVQAWRQEIRQATDALGTLNGGLLISTEGISKYISEFSRFDTRNQEDDLGRLGFSVDELAERVANGSISYSQFADAALRAGEVTVEAFDAASGFELDVDPQIDSIREVREAYNLTAQQVRELTEDGETYVDGTKVTIGGNDDLIESFRQLNEVIADGIQESVGEFVSNSLNQELLGEDFLAQYAELLSRDGVTDEQAIEIQSIALRTLGRNAEIAAQGIVGVSEATRRQIEEQTAGITDIDARAVETLRLLRAEEARVLEGIRNDFELFNSDSFASEFGAARDAVFNFSEVVEGVNSSNFGFEFVGFTEGIDGLVRTFPEVATATQNLFDQLRALPEEEFNAAARVMGADADTLRQAVEGAYQALTELQEQAVSTLPTVGSLLQDATGVREDGEQFFDAEGFIRSAQERISETEDFSSRINELASEGNQELAREAARQGPAAAAALAELSGAEREQLNAVIAQMESSEEALRVQIRDSLGPGIALEYGAAAGLIGTNISIGLGNGLNDPTAMEALRGAATNLLNRAGDALVWRLRQEGDTVRFVPITFQRASGGLGGSRFSEGGFVFDKAMFGGGPSGTDTVPAWLTPGEFVLRRAVAQAIPRDVLTSLNAGDPRMIGLLSSLNRTRPAGVDAVVASVTATTPAQSSAGFVIEQMNIQAPSPLESARQTADRLRIMQSQLSRR